jgi:hypothetical protein
MSTDGAILDCVSALEAAILGWLAEVRPDGGVHWGQGQKRVAPTVSIIPSTSGTTRRYIGGAASWAGEVAIRATGRTRAEAQALMAQVAAALPTEGAQAGYTITLQSIRPIMGPSSGTVSGIVYQANIRPGG